MGVFYGCDDGERLETPYLTTGSGCSLAIYLPAEGVVPCRAMSCCSTAEEKVM